MTRDSKIELVCTSVRSALRAGQHMPGERIDTEALAKAFGVSATSVRFALHRLVGEELIEDHMHDGFRVPAPSELLLRALYGGLQRLLSGACRMPRMRDDAEAPEAPMSGVDPVALTYRLFDSIARATDDPWLYGVVGRANDQLGPIRRMELVLLQDAGQEIAHLNHLWRARDLRALSRALAAYHHARRQLAPRIVAMYRARSNGL